MSMFLEGAGKYYKKKGHGEVGRGFSALAKLGARLGMPNTFDSKDSPNRPKATEIPTPYTEVSFFEKRDRIEEELYEKGLEAREVNSIIYNLTEEPTSKVGVSSKKIDYPPGSKSVLGIDTATDLSRIQDEDLKALRNLGDVTLKKIRKVFPYIPSAEIVSWKGETEGDVYPGTERLKEVADVYTQKGYPEVGEVIAVLGELGKKTGMPPSFSEQQNVDVTPKLSE